MTREEAINKWIIPSINKVWNDKRCKEILEALEQEPKTGHWIPIQESVGIFRYKCDKCGRYNRAMSDYCPNCGAKMIEPQESEDKE